MDLWIRFKTPLTNILCTYRYKPQGYYYGVGNFLVIDEIRARIAEGKIKHEFVQFEYKGEIIKPNRYGALPKYPPGFGDHVFSVAERTLRAAIAARKAEGTLMIN